MAENNIVQPANPKPSAGPPTHLAFIVRGVTRVCILAAALWTVLQVAIWSATSSVRSRLAILSELAIGNLAALHIPEMAPDLLNLALGPIDHFDLQVRSLVDRVSLLVLGSFLVMTAAGYVIRCGFAKVDRSPDWLQVTVTDRDLTQGPRLLAGLFLVVALLAPRFLASLVETLGPMVTVGVLVSAMAMAAVLSLRVYAELNPDHARELAVDLSSPARRARVLAGLVIGLLACVVATDWIVPGILTRSQETLSELQRHARAWRSEKTAFVKRLDAELSASSTTTERGVPTTASAVIAGVLDQASETVSDTGLAEASAAILQLRAYQSELRITSALLVLGAALVLTAAPLLARLRDGQRWTDSVRNEVPAGRALVLVFATLGTDYLLDFLGVDADRPTVWFVAALVTSLLYVVATAAEKTVLVSQRGHKFHTSEACPASRRIDPEHLRNIRREAAEEQGYSACRSCPT